MLTYETLWTASHVGIPAAEEAEVIRAAQLGDQDATLRLLLAYRPAMLAGIREYSPEVRPVARLTAADVEDFRSAAVMGVLDAIQNYDSTQNPSLAGIVRQYIGDSVAREAGFSASFSVPERTLKRFYGIARRADYDREAGAALAPEFEMRSETFLAIWSSVWVESTDTPNEEGDEEDGPRDPAALWTSAADQFIDAEDAILVDLAFRAVDETESAVCEMAYGFGENFDPVPDAEIAVRLSLSNRLKALRTRTRALDKMRTALGA